MGAKHFTELVAWQLAVELRTLVVQLVAQPRMRRMKHLIVEEDFAAAWQLSRRTAAAIAKLMRYLLTDRAQQAAARFARGDTE